MLFNLFVEDTYSLLLLFPDILEKPIQIIATIAEYFDFDLDEDQIQAVHIETQKLAINRRNEQRRRDAISTLDVKMIDGGLDVLNKEVTSAPSVDNQWRYNELTEDQYADATGRLLPRLLKMNFSTSKIPSWVQK